MSSVDDRPHPRVRRKIRKQLMREQNGECFYCSVSMIVATVAGQRDHNIATFDHLITRMSGGWFYPNNIVLACLRCNDERGCRPWREFKREKTAIVAPDVTPSRRDTLDAVFLLGDGKPWKGGLL